MVESTITNRDHDSDSSNSSLIKVGVNFETMPSIDINLTNLTTQVLSSESNVLNTNSDEHIPNITLDIEDEIPILVIRPNYTDETLGRKNSINNNNNNKMTQIDENSDMVANGINDFKSYLQSMINKLYETIDFLKQELEEKNLLIRALTVREANGDIFVNAFPGKSKVNGTKSDSISTENTTSNSSNVYTVEESNSNPIDFKIQTNEQLNSTVVGNELNETKILDKSTSLKLVEYDETLDRDTQDNDGDFTKTSDYHNGKISSNNMRERFSWEKHSNGFASNILHKMGYKGKGLGKSENGITEAVKIDESRTLGFKDKEGSNTKCLYIASSSMLNRIDEKRLSSSHLRVIVRSHGGCKIKCMYTHLPEMFKEKPTYVLLHIGSNDCTDKTSDEVLRELTKLVEYIKNVLPTTIVILSLPTVRTDYSRASAIQKNLTTKLKRSFFPILDNSNIYISDLGKKGLHFNARGTRKMAGNIFLSLSDFFLMDFFSRKQNALA